MASSVTLHFLPKGGWEYGVTEKVPSVGDEIERYGAKWVVVEVEESSDGNHEVTLTPSAGSRGREARLSPE